MTEVVLAIGTNQGDLRTNVAEALRMITEKIGHIDAQSSFIESHAVGFQSDNLFLNGAITAHTPLTAQELLRVIHEIEDVMGKTPRKSRDEPYTDRVIDIDIVYYGSMIMESNDLILPHPERLMRDFVLLPLVEIIPEWVDPVKGVTLNKLLKTIKKRKKEEKE